MKEREVGMSDVAIISSLSETGAGLKSAPSVHAARWEGLSAETYGLHDQPRTAPYAFPDLFIAYVHRGTVVVEVDEPSHTHVFAAGGLSIIPPDTPQIFASKAVESTAVYIKSHLLASEEFGAAALGIAPQLDPADFQIRHLMLCVSSELKYGLPGGRLFGETLLRAIALHVLARYAAKPCSPQLARGGLAGWQLKRSIELLEATLDRDISLALIAREVGLSPSYFCQAFKQSTGLPPYRWLREHRIARAREMLRDPKRPITEIALDLGFYSSSHFSTAFKRAVGLTPREYRRHQ